MSDRDAPEPPPPKATVSEEDGGGRATIPGARCLSLIVIAFAWPAGWALGAYMLMEPDPDQPLLARAFVVGWLIAWTAGGISLLRRLLPFGKRHGHDTEPPEPRATVSEEDGKMRITIPGVGNLDLTIFLSIWLIGWVVGEVAAPYALITSPPGYLLTNVLIAAWLICWTVGGIVVIRAYGFAHSKREEIEIDTTSFTIVRRFWLFPRRRQVFDLSGMCDLRVCEEGIMSFKYRGRTHSFGAALDERKLRRLRARIATRFPSLAQEESP